MSEKLTVRITRDIKAGYLDLPNMDPDAIIFRAGESVWLLLEELDGNCWVSLPDAQVSYRLAENSDFDYTNESPKYTVTVSAPITMWQLGLRGEEVAYHPGEYSADHPFADDPNLFRVYLPEGNYWYLSRNQLESVREN